MNSLRTAIVVCTVLSALYAVCPGASSKDTVVVLTLNKEMSTAAALFNNTHSDISLEVQFTPPNTTFNDFRMQSMVAGKVDLVDTSGIDISEAPKTLYNLERYFNFDKNLAGVANSIRAGARREIYTVPFTQNPFVVYVHNSTILETGIVPSPNWTWDDFYHWVLQLAASRLDRYATALDFSTWALPLIQLGGSLAGPFEKAEYGLQLVRDIQAAPNAHIPLYSGLNHSGDPLSFLRGEASSLLSSASIANSFYRYKYLPGTEGWRTLPLPSMPGTKNIGISSASNCFGIPVSSRKADQAWSVLRWLMLQEGSKALIQSGLVPLLIYPSGTPGLELMFSPLVKDVIKQESLSVSPYMGDMSIPRLSTSRNQFATDYIRGNITMQEAISGMNQYVNNMK